MRVAVLGAGVIGITTAYQLLKDGHEVTVVDREPEPASFTSFGNAGLIAPAHAFAWASPTAPKTMWRSIMNSDQAIRLKPKLDPRQWQWLMLFLKECTSERARINTTNKARLATYSQSVLQKVAAETGIHYDRGTGGLVYFYRSPRTFEAGVAKCELLKSLGMKIESLTPDEMVARDPALAPAKSQVAGAVFTPTDESGDCCLFTRALAKTCEKMGAKLMMNTRIDRIEVAGGEVSSITTSKGPVTAEAYVVCLGLYAPQLLSPLGIKIPIYPVKGYSMTIPVKNAGEMPKLGGVDEDNLLAYCPMGNRLRVTATAEIGGYSNSHKPSDFRVMRERGRKLFPNAVDWDAASMWAGLRPMTPRGMPTIDRSPIHNLWINAGHGHIGWTMSNGSARVVADLIHQRKPEIDQEGMRYEH